MRLNLKQAADYKTTALSLESRSPLSIKTTCAWVQFLEITNLLKSIFKSNFSSITESYKNVNMIFSILKY